LYVPFQLYVHPTLNSLMRTAQQLDRHW